MPSQAFWNIPWMIHAIFSNDLRSDQAGIVDQHPLTDIYLIEANLGDDLTGLNGRMKVRYFNRLENDLEEVYFRLLPNLWGSLDAGL